MRLKRLGKNPLISFLVTMALFIVTLNITFRALDWHRYNELIMKELLPLLPELKSEGKISTNSFESVEMFKENRDDYGPFKLNIYLISLGALSLGSWVQAYPCWPRRGLKKSSEQEDQKAKAQGENQE